MTAQAHDLVDWQHRTFLLVGVEGSGLFDPSRYGLETRPTTTANWRGWIARYAVDRDRLTLVQLKDVGLSSEQMESPPAVEGVTPTATGGSHAYEDLNVQVDFTGRLLIARDFIQSLYRHMGFHPAWKFEESWELDVAHGVVTSSRDVSMEMRELRKRIERGDTGDPDDVSTPGWIARTFRLDFWRSKGR